MAAKDLFSRLPSEIIIAILSRLSVRAIALSKCVCKPWLDLLASDYFRDSYHHSKSAAALAVLVPCVDPNTGWCKVFEIKDGVDDLESNNPITKFGPPYMGSPIAGSANGLVFLHDYYDPEDTLVYNPITREYIEISSREEGGFTNAYGFGASKVSGEHKVVRILFESDYCHVYTLGTARWRHVEATTASIIDVGRSSWLGAFVHGNIYWKVPVSELSGPDYEALIVCFDVETERFSTFPPPPVRASESDVELFTLRDCLCVLDESDEDGIGVWLMKDSWRKEYVIKRHPHFGFKLYQPVQVFANGDILVLCNNKMFCCYSIKTKTYQDIQFPGAVKRWKHSYIISFLLTPTFRSLKSFGKEQILVKEEKFGYAKYPTDRAKKRRKHRRRRKGTKTPQTLTKKEKKRKYKLRTLKKKMMKICN